MKPNGLQLALRLNTAMRTKGMGAAGNRYRLAYTEKNYSLPIRAGRKSQDEEPITLKG